MYSRRVCECVYCYLYVRSISSILFAKEHTLKNSWNNGGNADVPSSLKFNHDCCQQSTSRLKSNRQEIPSCIMIKIWFFIRSGALISIQLENFFSLSLSLYREKLFTVPCCYHTFVRQHLCIFKLPCITSTEMYASNRNQFSALNFLWLFTFLRQNWRSEGNC